ncbi:hypothetical protein FISHEDRAFT_70759 [Fistulina hepatica ATCC 64428]|uniref:BTB domain-containing protein n=1 Tax=Fistulina hepatica ATCC 64428 TaxID=1128425 RepID=A0A0D7AI37_9AGAR|nr:hypothetical protein FISHEDRAFT_70759 [Fistulina hepatica ATCC 64428]
MEKSTNGTVAAPKGAAANGATKPTVDPDAEVADVRPLKRKRDDKYSRKVDLIARRDTDYFDESLMEVPDYQTVKVQHTLFTVRRSILLRSAIIRSMLDNPISTADGALNLMTISREQFRQFIKFHEQPASREPPNEDDLGHFTHVAHVAASYNYADIFALVMSKLKRIIKLYDGHFLEECDARSLYWLAELLGTREAANKEMPGVLQKVLDTWTERVRAHRVPLRATISSSEHLDAAITRHKIDPHLKGAAYYEFVLKLLRDMDRRDRGVTALLPPEDMHPGERTNLLQGFASLTMLGISLRSRPLAPPCCQPEGKGRESHDACHRAFLRMWSDVVATTDDRYADVLGFVDALNERLRNDSRLQVDMPAKCRKLAKPMLDDLYTELRTNLGFHFYYKDPAFDPAASDVLDGDYVAPDFGLSDVFYDSWDV